MARSSQKGGYAFVKDAFGLPVAVLCSEDASLICKKNKLTFVELLRPFCRLTSEVRIRDQLGHYYGMTDLRVSLSEPQLEPISDGKHRLLLGQTVRQTEGNIDMEMSYKSFGSIEIGGPTPWYENYRDDFVQLMKQSDHEYIRHYMGSLLVVSSSNKDPAAAFTELYQHQKRMESLPYPKWMTPHVYCWHVLLHDVVAGDARRAGDSFERIKGQYGAASCYLLQINSRPSSSTSTESLPDPWSQFLRHQRYTEDIDTPAQRSQISRQLRHRESIDGKQETTSSVTSSDNNIINKDTLSKAVLKPDDVREEATLTSYDEPDSSLVTSSLSSANIELGNDPLSKKPAQLEERRVRSAQSSPYMSRTHRSVEPRTNRSTSLTAFLEQQQQQQKEHHQPSKPVVRYGVHLTLDDHSRLQWFLEEFVTKGLLPHLEQLTRTMNERLASRQGLRRTLISATRKWLGGGRQLNHMSPGTHNAINSSSGYAHDSPELQMRQLGDLAFLLQNYELSYQTYNSARKDYQVDHAWLLYAGAMEMTALSLFMMGSNKKELSPYFEDALAMYRSNTKNTSLILRCMLLHCEVLKSRSLYREAANSFLKMSTEDNDLLCALCMEQAAQCFLKHSMRRKYCFHMILAGHHYSKTAQRMHSARTYMQALKIIKDKSWILAEDYVNFSLARHSFSLKRLVEAKQAFEKLFVHRSTQLTVQQETNIKEYIFIHKQLLDQLNKKQTMESNEKSTSLTSQANTDHLPILPLPSINVAKTRVIFGVDKWTQVQLSHEGKQSLDSSSSEKLSVASSPAGSKSNSRNTSPLILRKNATSSSSWLYSSGACEVGRPRQRWEGLEGVAAAAGTLKQLLHKQILYLDHTTDNNNIACAVTNETIAVELQLENLLNVNLNLSGVSLIWDMEQKQDKHKEPAVSCEVISEYLLPASALKTLCLRITPLCEGNLHVSGILFNLGVDALSDLPPNSPLQSVMYAGNQFRLAGSAKDSVLYQTRPDLESYLAEGIQGRIPLSIVGRRVQQTKPYSVVQEEDYRLSWQIVPAMPKLLVGMCGFPVTLLAGEISRVLLEVENFGQEPLSNLRLASSHHHLLLLEKDPAVMKNAIYSTSVAEQTSDSTHNTMKMWVPSQWKDISLPDGRLSPGQKQQLSMLVQAPSNTGHHTVDMLYYYQPLQVTSKLDHRVVEHSCKMVVKESLNITYTQSSSYQPLYDDQGTFNLDKFVISLEIENKCQVTSDSASVREMRILQVTCVSPHWTIQRCNKQHGIISLAAGMAALLHLKVVRTSDGSKEDDTLLFSDVALGQAKVLTDKSPVCDLFFGSEVYHRIIDMTSSVTSHDGWSDSKVTSTTAVPSTSYLALIVFWQALLPSSQGTKFNYGQQYVLIPVPQSHQEQQRVLPNMAGSSVHSESSEWIRFSLRHPTHHPHNFSTNRVCVVPVKLLLHNCSHKDLNVLIDFSPQDTSKSGNSSANKMNSSQRFTQEFCWSGVCRRQLRMSKHATSTIDIQACFSRPGIYNLTNFSIFASTDSKVNRYQAQKWTTSSMIIIG